MSSPTVDYLPVATAAGANVDSQATFAGSGYQTTGFQNGLAIPSQINKALRQGSMLAAALANFISATLGISVIDDGNLATLITNLTNAIKTAAGSVAPTCTQNVVTGNRAFNTLYQNTSGSPMMVVIGFWSNDGAGQSSCVVKTDASLTPTTVVVSTTDGNDSSVTLSKTVSFWVIPGNYYKVLTDAALTLNSWTEWVLS
jgi:hypothetical protein